MSSFPSFRFDLAKSPYVPLRFPPEGGGHAVIDSVASIAYNIHMGTTLTIRNLDEQVKQKLRVLAATRGRAMEAEAREILTRAVMKAAEEAPDLPPVGKRPARSACDAVRGVWKGRMSTDEILQLTRGE